jgi:hypothetical protein
MFGDQPSLNRIGLSAVMRQRQITLPAQEPAFGSMFDPNRRSRSRLCRDSADPSGGLADGGAIMAVKNDKQYEALKEKGMSKERAAKIANSPNASSNGGKKSGSGGDAKQRGTTAQKQKAGSKGGKATARKS